MELQQIQQKIFEVREQNVMLDSDLAELYGTETKRLKEAVRRNLKRFPPDFMFELTKQEFDGLRTQFATSKRQVFFSNPPSESAPGTLPAMLIIFTPLSGHSQGDFHLSAQ